MTILEEILAAKKLEVERRKELYPARLLEQSPYYDAPIVSMRKYLERADLDGIIAEFKRRSPSKGTLNSTAQIERVSIGYMQAGASALSVLTDEKYFGGTLADLTVARRLNFCPILRKDFIVDEYQLVEARSAGADAILLIAAALTPPQCRSLAQAAKKLGLEVLLEVHSAEELERCLTAVADVDLVGVNNRNLGTFEVSLDVSRRLAEIIPSGVVKISESGIDSPQAIIELSALGYRGFLIGESFMRAADPVARCSEFIRGLRARRAGIGNSAC